MSVIEFRPTPGGAAFGSPGDAARSELRNTADYFIKQRAKFNISDAELFEESEPPNYSEKNSLLNGTPENQTWPPIFAKFVHYKEFPLPFPFSPLFENDDFMIVLNGADPYTAVYPDHEGGRAGMSFVHLLVLPKKRHIYNAVSLRATDIPLLKAMASGVREFVTDAANRNTIASRIKAQIGRNAMFKDNLEMNELLEADIAAYVADGNAPNELEFYFHVHPNHSVGYLHMHAIAGNMRANSTTSHDNKNTPLAVIIDVLRKTDTSLTLEQKALHAAMMFPGVKKTDTSLTLEQKALHAAMLFPGVSEADKAAMYQRRGWRARRYNHIVDTVVFVWPSTLHLWPKVHGRHRARAFI
jgi:hypothetical protein